MSNFLRRSLSTAVQLRGPVRSIWCRMQCTLRSPAAVTGCGPRGLLTGGQMNQCRDDTPRSALRPPLYASATNCCVYRQNVGGVLIHRISVSLLPGLVQLCCVLLEK